MHNVYDFGDQSISLLFLFPIPFLVVGLLIFFYQKNISNDKDSLMKTKKLGLYFGIVFSSFSTLMLISMAICCFGEYYKTKDIYDNHHFGIVEGSVENYHLYGHDVEVFDVKNTHFEYSYYDSPYYGYNTTASHDGVIKSNLYVKIAYFNDGDKNVILKLDVK